MKKQNLLKLAFTMMAMVFMTGAMAQTNTGQWGANATVGDYVRSNGTPITNPADALVTSPTDKITVNKSMPFWVWPSASYNPDFDYTSIGSAITNIVTGVVSDFAWVSAGSTITSYYSDGTSTDDGNGIKNYVEISWNTTGNKVIEVTETPSSALCPADPVYFGVSVIDVPSATIVGANSALGLDNVISSACWDASTPHSVAVNVTLPNAAEVYPYHFNVTYEVFNVSSLDGSGELPNDGSNVFNDAAAGVSPIAIGDGTVHIYGQDGAAYPTAGNPRILAAGTELVAAQDYKVQNNMITVYRLTYNNVNARISRKSDYIAARTGTWTATDYGNFSYYPTVAANTAKYIVSLPTPVTGPIYHIPNTFAY